jgi:hypothetical protein
MITLLSNDCQDVAIKLNDLATKTTARSEQFAVRLLYAVVPPSLGRQRSDHSDFVDKRSDLGCVVG